MCYLFIDGWESYARSPEGLPSKEERRRDIFVRST